MEDYHPISVTSIIMRVLEKMVVQKFIYPILRNPIYNLCFQDQYAFRPTRSTEAALIKLIDTVTNNLSKNKCVLAMSVDVSKAFDTVSHHVVINKLSNFDLPDDIFNWINDFLLHHKQMTKWGEATSSIKEINCGIVQGSGLGPFLFLFAISDLVLTNDMISYLKYADDTIVIFPNDDTSLVYAEWLHINNWARHNNLKINEKKQK